MSKGLVDSSSLANIAAAIRARGGTSATLKASEMAAAIRALPAGDAVLEPVTITENGTTTPPTGVDGFSSVTANIPNSFSASDEGKVVSSGALVAQTSTTITQNGTIDTTLNNEVVVNVSGGGGATTYTNVYHVWTQSLGGNDASINVQAGSMTSDGIVWTFTASGNVTNVLYSTVTGSTVREFGGMLSLGYSGVWVVKALSAVFAEGSTYESGQTVKQWAYYNGVDFYVVDSSSGHSSGGVTNILSGTQLPNDGSIPDGTLFLLVDEKNIVISNAHLDTGVIPGPNWHIEVTVEVGTKNEIAANGNWPAFWSLGVDTAQTNYLMYNLFSNRNAFETGFGSEITGVSDIYSKRLTASYDNGLYTVHDDDNDVVLLSKRVNTSSAASLTNTLLLFGGGSTYKQNLPCKVYNAIIRDGNGDDVMNLIAHENGMYDSVSQTVKQFSGNYTFNDDGTINEAFLKVNGSWVTLIGQNINDVNTGT